MTEVYIYRAAMLCANCAEQVIADLGPCNSREDSDDYPQGPYSDGGGEADTPQHCDHCFAFLENPLTAEGVEYVTNAIADHVLHGDGSREVLKEWADFYGALAVLSGVRNGPSGPLFLS